MTISKADVLSFISELVTRNPNLGIPPLEDGLFANLLIFDYVYYTFCFLGRERERRGERRERGGERVRRGGARPSARPSGVSRKRQPPGKRIKRVYIYTYFYHNI